MNKTQKVKTKRVKTDLALQVKTPTLPEKWDYDASVKKVRQHIYKWCNLTEDLCLELWRAREILSVKPADAARIMHGTYAPRKTWNQYCLDIGNTKSTINRWIALWLSGSLVGKLTGNTENYTPEYILDKAREVLGEIDLDPASCEYAQQIVKAKTYYTKENNGLDKTWNGKVFLNPPYGMPDIRNFTNKLIEELPNIEAAILLTNDQTDTDWWQGCAINAKLICMPDGRLSFYTPDKDKTSPTNGQTFFYYGEKSDKFRNVFSEVGLIVKVLN